MWIVSVMPIGAVAPHKEFSYWSAREVPEGGVVAIGPSTSKQYGLVMSCAPLSDLKQSVRNADFSLKKVRGGGRIFTREFLRAVFETAKWHACGAGAIIQGLTPQWVLESVSAGKTSLPEVWAEKKMTTIASSPQHEPFVGSRNERSAHSARTAQDALAAKKSCIIIAPTIIETEQLAAHLTEQCGEQVVLLHSGLTVTRARAAWKKIAETATPLAVVGTAAALSAPVRNIGAIILERAGARGYHRTEQRPFLDIGRCAEMYAKEAGARFITMAAAPMVSQPSATPHPNPLPLRGEGAAQNQNHQPQAPRPSGGEDARRAGEGWRTNLVQPQILDMRPPPQSPDAPVVKHRFQLFAPKTLAAISATLAANGNVLLICARRGLATHTVCDDCGTTVVCAECDATLVLYEEAKRIFRCPRCGLATAAKTVCRTCTGWRLRPLGVATERVGQDIDALFPEAPVMLLDEKVLANPRTASTEIGRFVETKGSVLVATEGALPYLTAPVAQAVIVSVDSFLSIPEFSASERAAQLLAACRELSEKPLIIQTRLPEHPAMLAIQTNDWRTFVREELSMRARLSYPPHTVIIRLSLEGAAEKIRVQRDAYLQALAIHHPQTFSGKVIPNPRAKTPRAREHILLRLPAAEWPDPKLLAFLRAIPPSVEIIVNPQSVFTD